MPKYNFICPNCNTEIDKFFSIKDYHYPLCVECNHLTVRDYTTIRVSGHVQGSMSLGSLAEANTKKLGKEGAATISKQQNDYIAPNKTVDDYLKIPEKKNRKLNRKGRKSDGQKRG